MKTESIEMNRRILVVDDSAAIHADFRKLLADPDIEGAELAKAAGDLFGQGNDSRGRARFDLTSAFQGQEGLEKVQAAVACGQPFALAFVDVRMPPGWDGVETTARLWQADPDLQIVVCTAFSDYSWDEMAARLGSPDRLVILKKPFDSIEVLQMANALTEKWRLAQQVKQRLTDLDGLVQQRTRALRAANEKLLGEIAERQRSQQEREISIEGLRASEERYRRLVELSPDPIYIQCEGKFAFINSAGLKLFGAGRPEDMLGKAVLDRVHPDFREIAAQRIATLRDEQKVVPLIEEKYLRLDGSALEVEVTAAPFKLESSPAAQVMLRDITGRKELERQLRHSQKMDGIGQLAGGVAHDFNNLLAVIRGNTELALMNGGQFSEPARDCLKQVVAAADRAANLTRQLLTFSRKQVMQPQPLSLNEVIGNLTKMLKRIIGEDVRLQCNCAAGLPLVQADAGMMEQVLVNLVVNARDAMPHGGQLEITTEAVRLDATVRRAHPEAPGGEFVCVVVSDTGTGIAAECLPRIFEPFFTTKELGKGTGLGLATAYGILKQHQGWIEVASRVGEGSTFKFFLPALEAAATLPLQRPAESKPRGGSETILLVEDDEAVRSLTGRVLQSHGYRVQEAASGRDALDRWLEQVASIDLLLTDIIMPDGVSGRELAEELRARRSGLKIVLMSGYSGEALGRDNDFLRQTKGSFLQKPCSAQTLLETIRKCLDEK